MVRSRDVVQAEGSARTEGARRATGVRADGAAAGAGSLAPGQRWSASRKRDVVLRLLRGESLEALSREAGVEIYRLDAWRERAMAGLELGLKDRHGEPVAEMLDAAKRHIGELSMEIELLRERARAAEQRLPLAMRRSRRPPRRRGVVSASSGCVRSGSARARRSTRGGRGHTTTGWARGRRGGGRRRGNRTRSCWRRFGPISRGPRSTAKAIARSTPGFGSWTGSASPARGCCASCGRTDCSPRTAGVRAPRRPTTGGSSPRRPT